MRRVNIKSKESRETMATHSGKLKIGNLILPCFVLNDGKRVFSQRGLQRVIGMSDSGRKKGVARIELFLTNLEEKGLKINKSLGGHMKTIDFVTPHGSKTKGYDASILSQLCALILEARRLDLLTSQNKHIADQAEMLMCAFAQVGVYALVDECTGYQENREKSAMQKILNLYLNDHARKWERTFPQVFFEKLMKIYKIELTEKNHTPIRVGKLVRDLVYCRLAPRIINKLEVLNPPDEKGIRENRHHQFLTETQGLPELKVHLVKLMAFMDAYHTINDFKYLVDKALPKHNENRLF